MNSDKKERVNFLQELKSNLNWLFSINNIDDHYVIKIFGIKICKKFDYIYNFEEVNTFGITDKKRDTKLIVSLTTYPARINSVYKTISTLLQQTLKPDEVILWLSEEQFPDKQLPENLTRLQEFGLSIKWCKGDIKSFKKLVPALIEYPNDIVVTVDDDNYYDKRLLEFLYDSYLENPKCIQARQAFVIKLNKAGKLTMNARNYTYNSTYLPSFLNEPVGCGGVLYPPKSLHENILNTEQFMKEFPTHDDLWFWGHAIRNNTKIKVLKSGYELKNYIVEGSQADSLWQKNMKNPTTNVGMTGECAINKMCELFPVIKERLLQEKD